jgi:predicted O-methyltransferase YrrM
MLKQTKSALRYLRHRLRSWSKFDLHSPFIYVIWSQILNDKSVYGEYRKIEKLRNKLSNEPGYLKMVDLGAGAGDIQWYHRIISIRRIIRRSGVSPSYGRLLFRISRYFKPAVTVELGTSLGISTSYLAMGNPEGQITTIEGCREIADLAVKNFQTLGLSNIHQIISSFESALPGVLHDLESIDLVFIDGNHRKKPTLQYFYQCLQHFHDDSVLIIDDIHWSAEMEDAWNEIRANPNVSVTIDLFRMGLVFFKPGLSKEDFILHF